MALTVPVRTVLTDALREIRVVNAVDPLDDADLELALRKANRILDLWSVKVGGIFSIVDAADSGELVPGLSPHTIGPDPATYVVEAGRPRAVLSAMWLTETGVGTPITVRTMDWWRAQSQQELTSTFPTDVAYDPEWPTGKLYFWPVPTAILPVQIWVEAPLSTLDVNGTLALPFGYQEAFTLTLAEQCVRVFGVEMPASLPADAATARGAVFGEHLTDDDNSVVSDLPGRGGGWFDYQTGVTR